MSFFNAKNINRAIRVLNGEKPKEVAESEGVSSKHINYIALSMSQMAANRDRSIPYFETMKQAKTEKEKIIKVLKARIKEEKNE